MSEPPICEKLRIVRGTQFTPYENELVAEAADTIAALFEALRNVADLVQMYGSASHDLEVREALSLALGEKQA